MTARLSVPSGIETASTATTQLVVNGPEDVPPAAVTVLWRLRKDGREVRCVAQYLSTGIDLRLMEREGFRRTQVCETATAANISLNIGGSRFFRGLANEY
jgi:hypothetical protein